MPSLMEANPSAHRDACLLGDQSPATIWHKSAPGAVREAFEAGRQRAGWKAWRRHLRRRKRPVKPDLWHGHPRLCPMIRTAGRRLHLTSNGTPPVARRNGRRSIGAGVCPVGLGLVPLFAEVGGRAAGPHVVEAVGPSASGRCRGRRGGAGGLSDDAILIDQLLAGELALTLAYLFPELAVCRSLLPAAHRSAVGRIGRSAGWRRALRTRHILTGCGRSWRVGPVAALWALV